MNVNADVVFVDVSKLQIPTEPRVRVEAISEVSMVLNLLDKRLDRLLDFWFPILNVVTDYSNLLQKKIGDLVPGFIYCGLNVNLGSLLLTIIRSGNSLKYSVFLSKNST